MISMTKRFRIGIGCAAAAALLLLSGCLTGRNGVLVVDPEGRFSYRVTSALQEVAREDSFAYYIHEEPDMDVYVASAESDMEQDALKKAFARAGIDYDSLTMDGTAGFGQWHLQAFEPEGGRWCATAYQYRGNTAYAFIVRGGNDSNPDSLPNPVMGVLASFTFSEEAGEVFVPETFADLEAYMDKVTARKGGSVSVAAIKDGKLIYQYASGRADYETPADPGDSYHWGSITKLVTASAVMQLVESGRVSLDETVDTYLPEFRLGSRITVRDLLGHTSGLIDDRNIDYLTAFGGETLPSLETVWADYWPTIDGLAYEARTGVAYANVNFLVLGVMVERVTGEDLVSYAGREILTPLGMDATAYRSADLPSSINEASPVILRSELEPLLEDLAPAGTTYQDVVQMETESIVYCNPYDILPCWGGVKGSAAQAARFGQLVIDKGNTPVGRILERRTIREMTRAQKSRNGDPLPFGLGWKVGAEGRSPYVEHPGGGPGIDSILRVYPKEGVSIAVMGSVVDYGSGSILDYLHGLLK